jgi:uncharacterized membrane protein
MFVYLWPYEYQMAIGPPARPDFLAFLIFLTVTIPALLYCDITMTWKLCKAVKRMRAKAWEIVLGVLIISLFFCYGMSQLAKNDSFAIAAIILLFLIVLFPLWGRLIGGPKRIEVPRRIDW